MDKMIEIIIQIAFMVLVCAVLLYACDAGLKKQAEVDYQECLSWQADGYSVKCDVEKYK